MAQIPSQVGRIRVYDEDGMWHGSALSGFGIISNLKVLKKINLPTPRRWQDLAEPGLFGWVGSGDPSVSGSVHAAYEMLLQSLGWQDGFATVCRIAGNVRTFGRGGSDTPYAVANGAVATGMAIDQYAWYQIERVGSDTCVFILPRDQTVITPDPIALFRGAPHREVAKKFIDFVLSRAGQRLIYLRKGAPGGPQKETLYRMSVRRDLYREESSEASVAFDPFAWDQGAMAYDHRKESRRWRILGDVFKSSIIDVHTDLKAAWRVVIQSGMDPALLARFGAAPETEQRLLELADTVYKSGTEAQRAAMRAEWTAIAHKKFRAIAAGR